MPVVIDDHLLLDVLADRVDHRLREELDNEALYTTGCWYYRLARAAFAGSGQGSLSGQLAALGSDQRLQALTSLERLPETVGLLRYRTVVPVMAALRVRRQLNMLNAEALAVALVVGGRVCASVESSLIRSGAEDLDVRYQVVG